MSHGRGSPPPGRSRPYGGSRLTDEYHNHSQHPGHISRRDRDGHSYHHQSGRRISAAGQGHFEPHSNHHQRSQPHHRGGSGHRPGPPAQEAPPNAAQLQRPPEFSAYKVIADPTLNSSVREKVVRYDGNIVPGDPNSKIPSLSDPRKRLPSSCRNLRKREPLDLPVPIFVIDDHFVGSPPRREVTLDNLNDNVDKQFLGKMVQKYGEIDDLIIKYHPVTKKHLGLARVLFRKTSSAKECVSAVHQKSIMGRQVNCYLDPKGLAFKKYYEDSIAERVPNSPLRPQKLPDKLHIEPQQERQDPWSREEDPPWERENRNWDGGGRESWRHHNREHGWQPGQWDQDSGDVWRDESNPPFEQGAYEDGWNSFSSHRRGGGSRFSDQPAERRRHNARANNPDGRRGWRKHPSDRESSNSAFPSPGQLEDEAGWPPIDNGADERRGGPDFHRIPPPSILEGGEPIPPPLSGHHHQLPHHDHHPPSSRLHHPPLPHPPLPPAPNVGPPPLHSRPPPPTAAAASSLSALMDESAMDPISDHTEDEDVFEGGRNEKIEVADPAASSQPGDQQQTEESEQEGEAGSRAIDLDTRLEMLFKQKTGNMPAFLMRSDSEEDRDNNQPHQKKEGPLSRAPSPFLDRENYLESYKLTKEHEESPMDVEHANSQQQHHPHMPEPNLDTSGGMSGLPPFPGLYGQPPGAPPGQPPYYPSHFPSQPYPGWGYMQSQPQGWPLPDRQYPPPPGYLGGGYHYPPESVGDHHHDQFSFQPGLEETKETRKTKVMEGKDSLRGIMDGVLTIVQNELEQILKKDINKKLCESYAYLLFDKWWTDQETKYKKKEEELKKKSGTTGSALPIVPNREKVEALPRIPKPEDLSSLIEKQRETGTFSFGRGGSLGLGFRGTIPKLANIDSRKSGSKEGFSTKDKLEKKRKKERSEKHVDIVTLDDDGSDAEAKNDGLAGGSSASSSLKKDAASSKAAAGTVYNAIYSDESDEEEEKKKSPPKAASKDKNKESGERSKKKAAENSSGEKEDSSSDADSSDEDKSSSSVSSSSDDDSDGEEAAAAAATSDSSSSGSSSSQSSQSSSDSSEDEDSDQGNDAVEIVASDDSDRSRPEKDKPSTSKSPRSTKPRSPSVLSARSRSRSRSSSRTKSPSSRKSSKRKSGDDIQGIVVEPTIHDAEDVGLEESGKGSDASPGKASLPTEAGQQSATTSRARPVADEGRRLSSPILLDSPVNSSTSPALSEPPTPDLKSATKKPPPALIKLDASETDTGTDIELVEEVSSPGKVPPTPTAISAARRPSLGSPAVKVQHVDASPPHIIDHCYARPAPATSSSSVANAPTAAARGLDHDYARPRGSPKGGAHQPPLSEHDTNKKTAAVGAGVKGVVPLSDAVSAKSARKKVYEVARKAGKGLPSQPIKFSVRQVQEKFKILYKFLTDGVDAEDVMYLKRSYEMMLNKALNQPNLAWINDTHWVDHTITLIPDPPRKKRRIDDFSTPHKTGSARTEGFYKMDPREKARTKYHFHRPGVDAFNTAKIGENNTQKPQKAISLSREARSQQRRMLTTLGDEAQDSDLLKFNQLKFRGKALKFGKSSIHDWGLFAMEHIGPDEMVIEYVGDVVRPLLSDIREKRYEKQGIGSSYLFRIDLDYVVDATKCGNLARFINHSCEPNCYAKVIKIENKSKIVIYSKQPIAIGEEITYDYKFPIEDEKIRCLCGNRNCRKYLN